MRKFDYYVPINLIHIFTIGHAIHEKYQESYPPEACEVPLSAKIDDIVISGHADIFYKGILYDIKTVSYDCGVKWYYKNQLCIYATLFEDYKGIPVKGAKLWLVNKSSGANKIYDVEIDKEVFEDAIEVAKISDHCLKHNDISQLTLNVGDN